MVLRFQTISIYKLAEGFQCNDFVSFTVSGFEWHQDVNTSNLSLDVWF